MEFKLYHLYSAHVDVGNKAPIKDDYYLIDLEKKTFTCLGRFNIDQDFINSFFKILASELICGYVQISIETDKFELLLESLGYKVA